MTLKLLIDEDWAPPRQEGQRVWDQFSGLASGTCRLMSTTAGFKHPY